MKKGYTTDFYKQFEELSKKLDSLLEESKTLKKEHKDEIRTLKKEFCKEKEGLKETIKGLIKQLDEANKLNEKLLIEIERLKNQINKNSNNSSKPSSTNIVTPKKKTGANLYNYRVPSKNKQGAQIGHKGHSLSKEYVEELINQNKVNVRIINHTINGKDDKKPIVKYRYGIEIKPYIEKHIFKYSSKSKEILPKEFYTDVTYDNSIKSLSMELGCYNVISYDRLSDFFGVITNNIIKISKGTLVNFLYEFSEKSKSTITNLENNFLNGKIGLTDETSTKFNGKKMYVRNYSNDNMVIYKAHKKKGHTPIKEDNILTRFLGGIMGDHDTTLYSYGTNNYECNVHLGRYLMELMENIPDIKWPFLMYDLIFKMNNTRNMAMSYKLKKFDEEKIKEYNNEYDNILKLADEENKTISSSFYKIQKAIPLYNRLIKYKENHLSFIKDFSIPFDDNPSEQDLRLFKNKTKISGGFRSIKAANCYVDALSIIKTSIKRNINPFESIKAIFDNQVLFNN